MGIKIGSSSSHARLFLFLVLGGALMMPLSASETIQEALMMRYGEPATLWTGALPVGNGRLGAMVFGGVNRERIQLNEDSLWSGGPQNPNNPEALQHLEEVRALLAQGEYEKAEQLAEKTLVCQGAGSGRGHGAYEAYGSYQTLGDLMFTFDHPARADGYQRVLDLQQALVSVAYTAGATRYRREVFSSHPAEFFHFFGESAQLVQFFGNTADFLHFFGNTSYFFDFFDFFEVGVLIDNTLQFGGKNFNFIEFG